MAAIIPVEIAEIILGHVKDKETLVGLLLVSRTFHRLTEPYLYSDISFCQARESTTHKFLRGLTAAGRCARFVKRIRLPIPPTKQTTHIVPRDLHLGNQFGRAAVPPSRVDTINR